MYHIVAYINNTSVGRHPFCNLWRVHFFANQGAFLQAYWVYVKEKQRRVAEKGAVISYKMGDDLY
jgi:hypothetical protein